LPAATTGNAGREESSQSLLTGTINNPGTCKNVVSVGATENWSGPRGTEINLLNSQGQQVGCWVLIVGLCCARPFQHAPLDQALGSTLPSRVFLAKPRNSGRSAKREARQAASL